MRSEKDGFISRNQYQYITKMDRESPIFRTKCNLKSGGIYDVDEMQTCVGNSQLECNRRLSVLKERTESVCCILR